MPRMAPERCNSDSASSVLPAATCPMRARLRISEVVYAISLPRRRLAAARALTVIAYHNRARRGNQAWKQGAIALEPGHPGVQFSAVGQSADGVLSDAGSRRGPVRAGGAGGLPGSAGAGRSVGSLVRSLPRPWAPARAARARL